MAHKWKQIGNDVYDLYLKNYPDEDEESMATLSCDSETGLWQLESYINAFNTFFLSEKDRDIKSLAEDFILQRCDDMSQYYEEIREKLEA